MKDQFVTEDAVLAAVILTLLNTSLIRVDRRKSKNPRFAFPKKDVFREFVEAYERGDLRVEPVIFSLSLSTLAERIEGADKN